MRIFNLVTALMLFTLLLTACESKSLKPVNVLFNSDSKKLATIPAGYEVGDVIFSQDGFHVAAALKKDGKSFMDYDSTVSLPYDEVRSPVFKSDGLKFAFIAKKAGKECVVTDGKEGVYYDGVTKPLFLADGRVAYTANKDSLWFIVVGITENQSFSSASAPVLFLSSDGKRLAHEELDLVTKKVRMVVSGIDFKDIVKGREYDSLAFIRSDLSSSHLVYVVGKNRKMTVVISDFNGPGYSEKEGGWYDAIKGFALTPDGKRLAFMAEKNGAVLLVADGKETPTPKLDMVLNVTNSVTGITLYSGVQKDKVVTFINGKDSGRYFETVDYMAFSVDGSHYLYVAGVAAKSNIVIDGNDGPKYDKAVAPRFSPDGKSVVYRARNSGKRFVVTADLQGKTVKEHSKYDAVWDTVFSPDGTSVGYGVKIGQELWWKVEKL